MFRKDTSKMNYEQFSAYVKFDRRRAGVIAGSLIGLVGGFAAMMVVALAIALFTRPSDVLVLLRELVQGDVPFFIWGTYLFSGMVVGGLFGLRSALMEEDRY